MSKDVKESLGRTHHTRPWDPKSLVRAILLDWPSIPLPPMVSKAYPTPVYLGKRFPRHCQPAYPVQACADL